MWYITVTVLPRSILLVSLNQPTLSTFWVMVEKSILRSYSLDFWAPIGFSGKVDFFEIAVKNPFMNRFQKGLLIPRGHVTSEITHHSDIDISKFHSRLFCVIGFFRYAPKISLIRRNFFHYFSRVADRLNSLRRDFHFFPTTLVFWDFWGSVGTFVFLVWFPTLGGVICSQLLPLIDMPNLHNL